MTDSTTPAATALGLADGQRNPGSLYDQHVVADDTGARYMVIHARNWWVTAVPLVDGERPQVSRYGPNVAHFNLQPGAALSAQERPGPLYDTGKVFDLDGQVEVPAPDATKPAPAQSPATPEPAAEGAPVAEDSPTSPPAPAAAEDAPADTGAAAIRTVRLDALSLSPLNVRQAADTGIVALAQNIREQGLIQNLTAVVGEKAGSYEVTAGGRRLRALQLLASEGHLPADFPVPVKVITTEQAQAVSLSENQMRQAMTPAEQFIAFSAQVDAGRPIADVAATFGVTETFVRQRLRLAALAPEVITALTDETITLAQAEAITVSTDHDRQRMALAAAQDSSSYYSSPEHLRSMLTETALCASDRRVKFLGLDAIREADPDCVSEDLFGESTYINNPDLVDRMVLERLQALADAEQKAHGWAWCDVATVDIYSRVLDYARMRAGLDDPTAEEAAKLADLKVRQDALDAADDDSFDYSEQAEVEHQMAVIEEAQALRAQLKVADQCGVLVGLGYHGEVVWYRGMLRPGQTQPRQPGAQDEEGGALPPGQEGGKPEKATGGLSRKLAAELAGHHTVAMQAALAKSPAVALRLTVWSLATRSLYGKRWLADSSVLAIGASSVKEGIKRVSPEALEGKAAMALATSRTAITEQLPPDAQDLWPWLLAADDATVMAVLAAAIAPSTTALLGLNGQPNMVSQLHDALDLDMRQWWQVSPTFLSRLPRRAIQEAVAQTHGTETAGNLPAKKADAVAAAAPLLAEKQWLPDILRRNAEQADADNEPAGEPDTKAA